LRVLDFAGLHGEKIGVDFSARGLEADFDFDVAGCRRARVESEERMLVARQLTADFFGKVAHLVTMAARPL
jgi:hypothetical protein